MASCWFTLDYMHTPRYIHSDEKGIGIVVGKTWQDIKWQIKWLGPSVRLLDTPRCTLPRCTLLHYIVISKKSYTRQPSSPGEGRILQLYCSNINLPENITVSCTFIPTHTHKLTRQAIPLVTMPLQITHSNIQYITITTGQVPLHQIIS